MTDEPTQQPPIQPTEPPEEKPEEKKENPTPSETENPNPSVPPEPPAPSTETSLETPIETPPPPAEEQPKTPEPQPKNPPQQPQSPLPTEASAKEGESPEPIITQEEVDKQITEKLKQEQDERRKLANEVRAKKKEDNLSKILEFSKDKKIFSNDDIRDLLHVSQSTATNYLSELVKRGSIKREGKRGGAKYSG